MCQTQFHKPSRPNNEKNNFTKARKDKSSFPLNECNFIKKTKLLDKANFRKSLIIFSLF